MKKYRCPICREIYDSKKEAEENPKNKCCAEAIRKREYERVRESYDLWRDYV